MPTIRWRAKPAGWRCRAMDRINERFGRHAVSVGPLDGSRIDRIGTKIAFGRIPDLDEFHE